MQPQPIDTAPKDGTAILTDEGVVAWNDLWYRWWYVYLNGSEMCIDPQAVSSGHCTDRPQPTLWTPLPDWMKPVKD
jgi:hypothetical protein